MYLIKALSSPLPSEESNLKDNKVIACLGPKAIHKSLSDKVHGNNPAGREKTFFISKTGILKENRVRTGI